MQLTAEQIGVWVLVFLVLLGGAANVAVLVASRKTQKRQVSLQENIATVPLVEKVERELNERINGVDADVRALKDSIVANGEKRRQAIEGKLEAVRLEMKTDAGELHRKVNEVAADVAGIEGAFDVLNQNMVSLAGKIDKAIERGAETAGRIGI